jgi:S-DNA-T family DNA segregation ATPase FtsK/SpoIIIE
MFLVLTMGILLLSLASPRQGQLTWELSNQMWHLFGWGGWLIPLFVGGVGLYMIFWGMGQPPRLSNKRLGGILLLFGTTEAFASVWDLANYPEYGTVWALAENQLGGGWFGGVLTWLTIQIGGLLGSVLIWVILGILGAMMVAGISRQDLFHVWTMGKMWWQDYQEERQETQTTREPAARRPRQRLEPAQPPLALRERVAEEPVVAAPQPMPEARVEEPPARESRLRLPRRKQETPPPAPDNDEELAVVASGSSQWQLPLISEMLNAGTDSTVNDDLLRDQVNIILNTLESFGAPVEIVETNQGPTVTQFGVRPMFITQRNGKRTKVKVGKIAGLADDLALALSAKSIRIQAPVPGKGYVGIEVPNSSQSMVNLRDIIESEAFDKLSKSPLRMGLGENVAGQPVAASLAKMPHMLIAGATGAGKSVGVNGIIACLLLKYTPEELRFVMIDPKRVELTGYNGIPHLVAPVVVDVDRVVGTLQWAMREMDNRYQQLAKIGVRNIVEYNKKVERRKEEKLPYIVIIIDELADLMMMAPEDTEKAITRLAQMARAIGIHMIIATQRPSVDVVTGLIKANFPARIAFAVSSSTDSRVILDSTGAERLLGQGDMLFQSPDAAAPVRLQGAFVSDGELERIIGYWKKARRENHISARTPDVEPQVIMPPATIDTSQMTPAVPPTPAVTVAPEPETRGTVAVQKPEARETTRQRSSKNQAESDTKPTRAQSAPAPEPIIKEIAISEPGFHMPPPSAPTEPVLTNMAPAVWDDLIAPEQDDEHDDLLQDAIDLVRTLDKASTSLLQRRFRIGYTRSARIMDVLEEQGIIGPPTGTSKAREVLPWQDKGEVGG